MAIEGEEVRDSIATNVDRLRAIYGGSTAGKDRPVLSTHYYTIGNKRTNKTTRMLRIIHGIGSNALYMCFNNTLVNLVDSITKRVKLVKNGGGYAQPPKPIGSALTKFQSYVKKATAFMYRPSVLSADQFAARYTGRLAKRYEAAANRRNLGLFPDKAKCFSSFLKFEELLVKPGKELVPRLITTTDPLYNLMIGCYLKDFEGVIAKGIASFAGYPVICKGMNSGAVAEKMRTDWESFDDPVAVGLDASRFDQHVSNGMLDIEFGVYNSIFRSKTLATLLEWQKNPLVEGKAADGTCTYVHSGRCSGVINTGMGNCLLMSLMVLCLLAQLDIAGRLSNNGDDCVVIMERKSLATFQASVKEFFLQLGFTVVVEDPVEQFERIEFCQTQPVRVSSGWRMVRNPFTATVKDACTTSGWSTAAEMEVWTTVVAAGGKALNVGVPFWHEWYDRFGLGARGSTAQRAHMETYRMKTEKNSDYGCHVITPESRVSFYYAFGLLPDAQVALENIDYEVSKSGPMILPSQLYQPKPLTQLLCR